jgi:hypothetical protein
VSEQFELIKLLNILYNADADPAFHSTTGPDAVPASINNADPDPRSCKKFFLVSRSEGRGTLVTEECSILDGKKPPLPMQTGKREIKLFLGTCLEAHQSELIPLRSEIFFFFSLSLHPSEALISEAKQTRN